MFLFILAILGISACMFGLGWSSASVYHLTKFHKQWSEMSARGKQLEQESKESLERVKHLENQYKLFIEKQK